LACFSSVSVPFFVKWIAGILPISPIIKKFLMGNIINLFGILAASSLNIICARYKTMSNGIYPYEDIDDLST